MNTPSPFPASFTVPANAFQSGLSTFSAETFANPPNLLPGVDSTLSKNIDLEAANALWDSQTPISQTFGLSGLEVPGYASSDPTWTFICTPEEISWTTANAVNRVDIFGTNNPPAVSGTKGLREFSLNNALVEGFTRNKQVEAKVSALEDLLKYKSSLAGGFVNVPVYQVWANQKGYGQQAYFLIKSVQVKETMRDLTGYSTRAFVDISFVEVPAYQVDSGIDQAPFGQQGRNSNLSAISLANAQANVVAVRAQAQARNKSAPPPTPATR